MWCKFYYHLVSTGKTKKVMCKKRYEKVLGKKGCIFLYKKIAAKGASKRIAHAGAAAALVDALVSHMLFLPESVALALGEALDEAGAAEMVIGMLTL